MSVLRACRLQSPELLVCSFMAWNNYPPIQKSDVTSPPRLFPHADMDCISLLWQRNGAPLLQPQPAELGIRARA